MAQLYTYDPSDVSISVGGIHTVSGYVDGTFINIVSNTKPVQTQRAMDGTIERLYTKDEGYTVTVTLAQTSVSNNILSAIFNIDAVTRMGKFPLIIKDGQGQSVFFAADAWISKPPDVAFGKDMQSREWQFETAGAALAIAGNGQVSDIPEAVLLGAASLPLLRQFGLI